MSKITLGNTLVAPHSSQVQEKKNIKEWIGQAAFSLDHVPQPFFLYSLPLSHLQWVQQPRFTAFFSIWDFTFFDRALQQTSPVPNTVYPFPDSQASTRGCSHCKIQGHRCACCACIETHSFMAAARHFHTRHAQNFIKRSRSLGVHAQQEKAKSTATSVISLLTVCSTSGSRWQSHNQTLNKHTVSLSPPRTRFCGKSWKRWRNTATFQNPANCTPQCHHSSATLYPYTHWPPFELPKRLQ